MDESSLLEQPSDIDELEKVKAIESIVLDSGRDYTNSFDDDDDDEDHLHLDEDDSELRMLHSTAADSSSVNVTNSMYDESLKSTDVENGSESCCTATKEVELDSMDDERSTNILASSEPTSTRPRSISPEQQPHHQTENEEPLRLNSPPQARILILRPNASDAKFHHQLSKIKSKGKENRSKNLFFRISLLKIW